MTPVDKASWLEKEQIEKEEDLRREWVEEDIQDENRKPNLEEVEDDSGIL
jgi:hypothetical protein